MSIGEQIDSNRTPKEVVIAFPCDNGGRWSKTGWGLLLSPFTRVSLPNLSFMPARPQGADYHHASQILLTHKGAAGLSSFIHPASSFVFHPPRSHAVVSAAGSAHLAARMRSTRAMTDWLRSPSRTGMGILDTLVRVKLIPPSILRLPYDSLTGIVS